MSLTVNTESAISGRGMKNMSPLAGFHARCGPAAGQDRGRSRVRVSRAAQEQRQQIVLSSGDLAQVQPALRGACIGSRA